MSNIDCCSICSNTIKDNIYTTTCGHKFHKSCIYKKYEDYSQFGKCPSCKTDEIKYYSPAGKFLMYRIYFERDKQLYSDE